MYQLIDNSGLHPEKVFDRQLIEEALTEAIESLPEEQRMVFILQELDGMTFKEISKFTGESINTLLSRKRYAVQFLRKELKEIKSIIDEM